MTRLRFAYLAMLYLLAVFWGVRVAVLPEGRCLTDAAMSLSLALVVTQLCILDSRVLHKPLVHAAQWLMLFTWPLTAPVYLLWSRRAWGLLLLIVHVALLFMLCMAVVAGLWVARPDWVRLNPP